jgi:hypothetical protein
VETSAVFPTSTPAIFDDHTTDDKADSVCIRQLLY